MEDYKTYYNTNFQNDKNSFFSTIPDDSKYHNDKENKEILTIQYERLTSTKKHLNFLENDEKENFGIALFFNVLVDMVIYTHFKTHYSKFREQTKYPKLIGNCLTMCRFHLHPKEIFTAMNLINENFDSSFIEFLVKFNFFSKIVNQELTSICNTFLKEIDINKLWEKCESEFPFKKSLLNKSVTMLEMIKIEQQMKKDLNDAIQSLDVQLKKEELLYRKNISIILNEKRLFKHIEKELLKNIGENKLKELSFLNKKKITKIENQLNKSKLIIKELEQKLQSLKERQDNIPKIR
jgi:hypothetical protein